MNYSHLPNQDTHNHLDFVVSAPPPNDNTDGQDCVCGHAETDHHPSQDSSKPTWKCLHCACTRAYPARVPSNS
ncbi:hypothetical protein Rhe02_19820 [Rhizocola hellebori]|uniref:Uncharacterized protein n=1 Tax=Rhizocola hellebori TaxID=1392758 RepID=A0A8J3Q4Y9_9ACTN|nr:hypothetical protein [Rhizocola hellebori]GIH03915.1 hypothetical protein Rhe02_19820 [Rhizocola hellebori]